LKNEVARLPVTVRLEAVVEARVDEPETARVEVEIIDPAIRRPWAVVEASDDEVVEVRTPKEAVLPRVVEA
jgi:hypothetical protein